MKSGRLQWYLIIGALCLSLIGVATSVSDVTDVSLQAVYWLIDFSNGNAEGDLNMGGHDITNISTLSVGSATIEDLEVIGEYTNISVTNYNVTGTMDAENITADYINTTGLEVNGDTMRFGTQAGVPDVWFYVGDKTAAGQQIVHDYDVDSHTIGFVLDDFTNYVNLWSSDIVLYANKDDGIFDPVNIMTAVSSPRDLRITTNYAGAGKKVFIDNTLNVSGDTIFEADVEVQGDINLDGTGTAIVDWCIDGDTCLSDCLTSYSESDPYWTANASLVGYLANDQVWSGKQNISANSTEAFAVYVPGNSDPTFVVNSRSGIGGFMSDPVSNILFSYNLNGKGKGVSIGGNGVVSTSGGSIDTPLGQGLTLSPTFTVSPSVPGSPTSVGGIQGVVTVTGGDNGAPTFAVGTGFFSNLLNLGYTWSANYTHQLVGAYMGTGVNNYFGSINSNLTRIGAWFRNKNPIGSISGTVTSVGAVFSDDILLENNRKFIMSGSYDGSRLNKTDTYQIYNVSTGQMEQWIDGTRVLYTRKKTVGDNVTLWVNGSISAEGINFRTQVNTEPDAFDSIIDGSQKLNPDGSVNHSAGSCMVQREVPDTSRPETYYVQEQEEVWVLINTTLASLIKISSNPQEIDMYLDDTNGARYAYVYARDEWVNITQVDVLKERVRYPYTTTIVETDGECMLALHDQAFANLNENIDLGVDDTTIFETDVLASRYLTNTTRDPATLQKVESFYENLAEMSYTEAKGLVLTPDGKLSDDILFDYEMSDIGSYDVAAMAHTSRAIQVLALWKIAQLEKRQQQQDACWDLGTQQEIVACMRSI